MQQIAPGLHTTEPYDLGFGRTPLQARSYVLVRTEGNLAVYGADPLEPELDALRALGGVTAQYVNHVHEVSPAAARVRDALSAPLHAHEADGADADVTFTERHLVGEDFEVIPAPGHTPGATSFLWTTPEHRVLFTGDTVSLRDGEWVAALLDGISDRTTYLETLELLAGLEFDLLVPGIAPVGDAAFAATTPEDARRRLGAIARRLRAGEDG
jgi:glyoxylase-like metal-dependent hydrolase (beta-lactamase superfamily II)